MADDSQTKVTGKQNAPALKPSKPNEVIDVVKDFQWTASLKEKSIVRETPHINFREYQVIGNAAVQQAKYMLGFAGNTILANVGTLAGGAAGAVVGGAFGMGAIGAAVGAGAMQASGVGDFSPKGYLEPYKNLYAVTPTGFQYRFPFFEENFRATLTNWQGPQVSDSPLGQLYKAAKTGGGNMAMDAAMLLNEPNTFIEESMQYEHPKQGTQFQFTFHLSNTHSYADVVRNWHLAYLLLYQNLPNRSSVVLIRPPVIHEVSVPGIFYHPYCFINSLGIVHKGAQRKMKIDVSTLEKDSVAFGRKPGEFAATRDVATQLDTIVPDAYEIKIQVTPLVKETQNFMYHSTTESTDSIYDIEIKD